MRSLVATGIIAGVVHHSVEGNTIRYFSHSQFSDDKCSNPKPFHEDSQHTFTGEVGKCVAAEGVYEKGKNTSWKVLSCPLKNGDQVDAIWYDEALDCSGVESEVKVEADTCVDAGEGNYAILHCYDQEQSTKKSTTEEEESTKKSTTEEEESKKKVAEEVSVVTNPGCEGVDCSYEGCAIDGQYTAMCWEGQCYHRATWPHGCINVPNGSGQRKNSLGEDSWCWDGHRDSTCPERKQSSVNLEHGEGKTHVGVSILRGIWTYNKFSDEACSTPLSGSTPTMGSIGSEFCTKASEDDESEPEDGEYWIVHSCKTPGSMQITKYMGNSKCGKSFEPNPSNQHPIGTMSLEVGHCFKISPGTFFRLNCQDASEIDKGSSGIMTRGSYKAEYFSDASCVQYARSPPLQQTNIGMQCTSFAAAGYTPVMVTACSPTHILAYSFMKHVPEGAEYELKDASCMGVGSSSLVPAGGMCRPWGGNLPDKAPVYEKITCAEVLVEEPKQEEGEGNFGIRAIIVCATIALTVAVCLLGSLCGKLAQCFNKKPEMNADGTVRVSKSSQRMFIQLVNPKFQHYSSPCLLALCVGVTTVFIFGGVLAWQLVEANCPELDVGAVLYEPNVPESMPNKENIKCLQSLKNLLLPGDTHFSTMKQMVSVEACYVADPNKVGIEKAWCPDAYGAVPSLPVCYGNVLFSHFLFSDCPTLNQALSNALAQTAYIEMFVTVVLISVFQFFGSIRPMNRDATLFSTAKETDKNTAKTEMLKLRVDQLEKGLAGGLTGGMITIVAENNGGPKNDQQAWGNKVANAEATHADSAAEVTRAA